MRFGLAISILLHAAVLALAVITFTRTMPILDIPKMVPVDVVTMADKVNVTAKTKEAEKAPEAPPKPKPEPMPPPAPPPEPAPPSIPEPDIAVAEPAPKPKPKDEAKPKKTAEATPQPRPTPPKPKEKKKPKQKFSLDSIALLLNKEKKKEAPQEKTSQESPDKTKSDKARSAQSSGTANTIDLITSMQRQVEKCWSFPAGAVQPEKLDVYVDINLKPDGSLSGAPVVENQARMSEPYFRAAAEAAVRALYQCQPFDLPKDQYDDWKEVRLNFDPSRMIGL